MDSLCTPSHLWQAYTYELDALAEVTNDTRILEIMPYGGSYTTAIFRRYGDGIQLFVTDMSEHNLSFVRDRVRSEGFELSEDRMSVMSVGELVYDDETFDFVMLPQTIESVPDPLKLIDECWRVLKPSGRLVITMRNAFSWFGLYYLLKIRRGTVPNFGPYVPRSLLWLKKLIRKWPADREWYGISPSPWAIAKKVRGRKFIFCRLLVTAIKKP